LLSEFSFSKLLLQTGVRALISRRKFIQATAAAPLVCTLTKPAYRDDFKLVANQLIGSKFGGQEKGGAVDEEIDKSWFMPEEGEPHERTWMSFGASKRIWGGDLIDEVRKNLATIAETIAQFEPVVMCVRPKQLKLAKEYFTSLKNIEFVECPLDDLWIRDYGAVYVVNDAGEKAAVDFNFNGWGEKQKHSSDAGVAAMMAKKSDVELIKTELCLEGGGVEIDGEGTAIVTESCVLNANRNPKWTKKDCEEELLEILGLEKIIWLPGVRDADITDGHTDFYARFVKPGVAIAHFDTDKNSPEHDLTKRHLKILESATDARGEKLKVIPIDAPTVVREEFETEDFCAGYINFYVCNGAVIATEFGDEKADKVAKKRLAESFPDREIVMLNIDGIAAGGGGIHCATQQEPKV
jgi:agmatine deiminase